MTTAEAIANHRGLVHHLLVGFPFSKDEREDVVQDVLLKCLRSVKNFSAERGTLASWMASVTHSVVMDRFRRARRRPQDVPLDLITDL